jgi:hypothetical protein
MEAVKYEPKLHFSQICEWAKKRGLSPLPSSGFPKTGRIVVNKCALFLYKTDSDVGFVENMISSPDSEKSEIPEALDLCFAGLDLDAKEMGVRFLFGSSFIPAVADHAKRNGYIVKPESYRLLAKEIT